MAFLHEIFNNPFAKRALAHVDLPNWVTDNLKPEFGQRPYQIEAFKRYIYLDQEDLEEKAKKALPLALQYGNRKRKNFDNGRFDVAPVSKRLSQLFVFVNSNNIIQKTKDNFLNPQALKYLFNNKISD